MDRPIKCDVANGSVAHAYTHTMVALGMLDDVEGNGISYKDFCANNFLMAWSFDDVPTADRGKVFHIKKKEPSNFSFASPQQQPKLLHW